MAGSPLTDDRITPLTRAVAAVVIAILVLAWVVLFLKPAETDTRFAWTISSTMTAMLMGAGYGSALYFFTRVLTGRRWHEVGLGFLPTSLFTWMMLGATFLHWDTFRHGSSPFLLWFWVYLATPLIVPAVWLANRRRDPHATGELILPVRLWPAMVGAGALMLAVSAFVALPGAAWLAIASDLRWSSARVMLGTIAIGLAMLLIAVARAWGEFDHSNPLTYIYVAGLVGTLAAIAALSAWMRRRTA